ncbi:hypothetical protein SAMN04487904_101154 [Actinopolyspora lacussalsi subsp. righensis]|uniref:Terpene synthase n=1 Tax=Actinopolyspora righensis TaxID=995060 RepID=A0A1I6X3Y1_9ACTN|nr:terpene synthase family protein [Actinopolyspora righensis]SFT33095.1 hypothetical protein SAMN04487904_101154 [Actinopolyspora righensis]
MTGMRERFRIPPFYCPIEPALHPDTDRIEKRAIEWIDRVRVYENETRRAWVLGTNSAEFFSRFAPEGIADNVVLAAQWVYWGFAFDDVRCDNGPLADDPAEFAKHAGRAQRVLEAPRDTDATGDRYLDALHDIGLTMRELATPTQVRRFIDAHRAWLYCVAWQVGNRARGEMPDLDDYLAMRLGSSGGFPTMALLEIGNGAEVPAAEMDHPTVRAATEAAILTAGLDNDLHSYRKELRQDSTDQNIINVMLHHECSDLEWALAGAVGLRDRIFQLYLRLRDQLLPNASEELRTYLNCLAHGVRGNIDWALRVPRYTSLTDPEKPPVEGEQWTPHWSETPYDPSTGPPALPAISWWWDRLDSH